MKIKRFSTYTIAGQTKKAFNWDSVQYCLINMRWERDKLPEDSLLKQAANDTYDASEYYITTGRAYIEWQIAWTAANSLSLFKYVAKHYDGTIMGTISLITAYLNKYCKLQKMLDNPEIYN